MKEEDTVMTDRRLALVLIALAATLGAQPAGPSLAREQDAGNETRSRQRTARGHAPDREPCFQRRGHRSRSDAHQLDASEHVALEFAYDLDVHERTRVSLSSWRVFRAA